MPFELAHHAPILERTPRVIDALLRDLPAAWTDAKEGPDAWSPIEIVGHFIHGENRAMRRRPGSRSTCAGTSNTATARLVSCSMN